MIRRAKLTVDRTFAHLLRRDALAESDSLEAHPCKPQSSPNAACAEPAVGGRARRVVAFFNTPASCLKKRFHFDTHAAVKLSLCAPDFLATREPPSMASNAPPHHPHQRVSLEEREVHRIYQPWLSAHGSSLNVASHVDSLAQEDLQEHGYEARSSRDKALTAYAQLVALRLDVRRCMISLIDTSNQYILAEATRTVSIASSRTAEDDELWLGSAVLSRPDAVCEHCMINTCTAVDEGGATLTAKGLIVPDCRLDERFKDRPYVQSEPGVRFYAGVPIYSRNGYMIGAVAVSDDDPRATLKVEELRLMQETAQSVIEHLECELPFDPTSIPTGQVQWSVDRMRHVDFIGKDMSCSASGSRPRVTWCYDKSSAHHNSLCCCACLNGYIFA